MALAYFEGGVVLCVLSYFVWEVYGRPLRVKRRSLRVELRPLRVELRSFWTRKRGL